MTSLDPPEGMFQPYVPRVGRSTSDDSMLQDIERGRKMIEDTNGIDYIGAATDVLSFAAGLDTTTPHGQDTPRRFLEMLQELTTPKEFKFTTFPNETDEMIIETDISFVSLCNHHVVPFIGVAHIAYVPDKAMAGLSKLARTVHYFAASLNMQEGLTDNVAQYLDDALMPKGVAVVMEAEHLCMTIRGVKAPGTKTRTAKMMGVFADHTRTAKAEFLAAINSPRR